MNASPSLRNRINTVGARHPALRHPRLLRHRHDDEGRDQSRHRRARLRHALACARIHRVRPRTRRDALHQQPRLPRTAQGARPNTSRKNFGAEYNPGRRSPRHRRRQRGAGPRVARADQSRRRSALSRAVLRLVSRHDPVRRRRAARRRDESGERFPPHPRDARGEMHAEDEGVDAEFPEQSHRRDHEPAGFGGHRRVCPSSATSSSSPTRSTPS